MDKFELFERYFSFGFNLIQKDDIKYDEATDSTVLHLEIVASYAIPMDDAPDLGIIVQDVVLTQNDDSPNRTLWSQNQTPFCVQFDGNIIRHKLTFISKGRVSQGIVRDSLESAEVVATLESKKLNESIELTSSISFDSQSGALVFGKPKKRIINHANQTDEVVTC